MSYSVRTLLLLTLLSFSTVLVVGEAQAQSMQDMKKLKNKLTKKKEREKKAPAAARSSRNDPLENSRNSRSGNAEVLGLNEDANSIACFTGNKGRKVCIPEKTVNNTKYFSVKSMTLDGDFSNCTLGNTIPQESKSKGVSFRVYCRNAEDTLYTADFKATSELYYISNVNIDVCGPQVVDENSTFIKKIQSRYSANSEMNLLNGYTQISFHSNDTSERLNISQEAFGKYRNRRVQSECFTDNGTLWHFRIDARQGDLFKDHLKELQMGKQPTGDDF